MQAQAWLSHFAVVLYCGIALWFSACEERVTRHVLATVLSVDGTAEVRQKGHSEFDEVKAQLIEAVKLEKARTQVDTLAAQIASGAAKLGFRGEDVKLTTREQGIPFVVRVAEPMGSHMLLTGQVENDLARVVAPSDTQIAPGAAVGLALDPSRLSLMDAQSGAVLGK